MAGRTRLSHIDGLRGLAAMLVVFDHLFEVISFQRVPEGLAAALKLLTLDILSPGRIGVVAFFCISGFVIPFSFKGPRPLRHFVVSRFFRLYPAHWLALLAALAGLHVLGHDFSTRTILANVTMLTKFLGQPYILGVAWTLTVELIFYGICFVVYSFGLLRSARFQFSAMTAFYLTALAMGAYRWFHPGSGMPAGIVSFLGVMHFGALIRLWRLEDNAEAARLSPVALIVMAILVPIANTLGYYHSVPDGSEAHLSWIALSVGYFAGVALFLACVWKKWFATPFMIYLGAISYSIYLLHPTVLDLARGVWPFFDDDWATATLVLGSAYVVVTLAVSTMAYRWLERPMIRIGHHVADMTGRR